MDFRPVAPATVWVPSCFVIAFVLVSRPFLWGSCELTSLVAPPDQGFIVESSPGVIP